MKLHDGGQDSRLDLNETVHLVFIRLRPQNELFYVRHETCPPNDTAVQRRAGEGAKRPSRASDCNGGLGSCFEVHLDAFRIPLLVPVKVGWLT